MFRFGESENFKYVFWIDKIQQHPITKIDVFRSSSNGVDISEVSCYKNYYINHFGNYEGILSVELNVLTNDNNTYKSETLIQKSGPEVCGPIEVIVTAEIKLGATGKTLLLYESAEYKNGSSDNVNCPQFIDTWSSVLYLIEDYPLTPNELCSL